MNTVEVKLINNNYETAIVLSSSKSRTYVCFFLIQNRKLLTINTIIMMISQTCCLIQFYTTFRKRNNLHLSPSA